MVAEKFLGFAGLLLVLLVVLFPAFSSGHVIVEVEPFSGSTETSIRLVIEDIAIHKAGYDLLDGWVRLSRFNKAVELSRGERLAESEVHGGGYDAVRVTVSSASMIAAGKETQLLLKSTQYTAKYQQSWRSLLDIRLSISPELQVEGSANYVKLTVTATTT